MQTPNKKAAPFPFHRCMFYSSSLSLISQWILRTRTFISSHIVMVLIVLGTQRKTQRPGMRLNLRCKQWTNNSYRMLCFESFVFTCLTYRNVQRLWNGPVHEFYGLKTSQMSKVRASSRKYPHVEKSRIFGNRISTKVRQPTIVTSRNKENLTAERITSHQKE